jgi:hypothetical protein
VTLKGRRKRARDWRSAVLENLVREYSDVLLIFLLKAHRPEKYRERLTLDHVDWASIVKTWTDAQLVAFRQGVPLPTILAMSDANNAAQEIAAALPEPKEGGNDGVGNAD